MYPRYLFRHSKYSSVPNARALTTFNISPFGTDEICAVSKHFLENSSTLSSPAYEKRSLRLQWRNLPTHMRKKMESPIISPAYSSKGDGKKANDDTAFSSSYAHARLGEQDQREWLVSEMLAIESKKMESPFISRRERFRNEFLRRIVPWEKISVSWDTIPYYLHEHTKNLLVECTASRLKHKKFTTDYGGQLNSSSGRILLQSIPGTELYRERLVKALARDLKVPLMVFDGSSILAPYDFVEDESESDEKDSECSLDSVIRVAVKINAPVEFLKKLLQRSPEEFEKSVLGDTGSSTTSSKPETAESSDTADRPLKKGDRVKYCGQSVCIKANNRTLSCGQRGDVYEVNGDHVAVIFHISGKAEEVKEEKSIELAAKPSVLWLNVKDIERDLDAQTHDCYVAMEVLCEIMKSEQQLLVYFPASSLWFFRAVSKSNREEFIHKIEKMFDGLSGPVVLICGKNTVESVSNEKEISTMMLPILSQLSNLGLKPTKRSDEDEIYKLFTNVMSIYPPKEEDSLRIFDKQIEEDRRIVTSRSNLSKIHKVFEKHGFSCVDLLHVNTNDVILTKESKKQHPRSLHIS